MAVTSSLKGTSYPSFTVGKKGPTILQGSSSPSNSNGNDGDIYIQYHSGSNLNFQYQKINGTWRQIQRQHAFLDEISALSLVSNGTIASDGTNIIINGPSAHRTAMGLGSAAVLNADGTAGNLVALDSNGLLPTTCIPPLSIINVYVVADTAARDNLANSPGVQTGDVAIVSSNGLAYIYDGSQWHVLAAASAVQAIQTNQVGVVKTGIVSLAASDILSGVFPEGRGGTNQSSYTAGDLLVGNSSNGLSKVSIGSNGKVLKVISGVVGWNTQIASDVTFTANTGANISSTTVQNAIVEIANEHTFINVGTTKPTISNDSSQNFKVGDMWINSTDGKVYIATNVSIGTAVWSNLSATAGSSSNSTIWYVSQYGSDDSTLGDGSVNRPYLTIGNAISNANPGDIVRIYPGTYTENVTPDRDISLEGVSVNRNLQVIISGTLTLGNSHNFSASKISFQNTSNTVVSLSAGSKNYVFDNCQMLRSNLEDTCVSITGTVGTSNVLSFSDSMITGTTVHNHSGIALYDRCWGPNWKLYVANSGATVKAENVSIINYVAHSNGSILLSRIVEMVGLGNGDAVVSSSNSGLLYMHDVDLHHLTTNSFSNIDKTGSCDYLLSNVNWNSQNTLTGSRRALVTSAKDSYADFASPTKYTPATDSVTDHLKGIDTKFSNISIQEMTDVPDFAGSAADANKTLMIDSTGAAIKYQKLGTTYEFSASTYNVVNSDFAKNLNFIGSSTTTINLPTGTNVYDGWYVNIKNKSTVSGLEITIAAPTNHNINGSTTLILRPQEGFTVFYGGGSTFNTYTPPKIRNFYELDDAPKTYTSNKFLKINTSGTAVICSTTINTADITGLSQVATGGAFTDLSDTISSYTGHGMKVLRVASNEMSVEPGVILGTVATKDYGTGSGQIPILDSNGKLQSGVIPHISLTNVTVVTTNAQRDALNPLTGDVCRVTSTGITWMWSGTQWISIQTPDVIQSVNGYTGTVVLAASDIGSTTDTTNHIASTNVQNALSEIAGHAPFITVSTSSPTINQDSSNNYKQGDIWVNTATSRVYFALSVATGAAVWSEAGGGSPFNNVSFVSTTGNDSIGDGSIARPFATIQHAVENTNSVVMIAPGTYSENITLDQNVCLIGMGDPSQTVITSLDCKNTAIIQVKNLSVNNGSGISITVEGSNILFDNVISTSSGSITVKTLGSNNGTYKFMNSSIVGTLTLTRSAGTTIIENTSQATNVTATGEKFQAKNCSALGSISHSSGILDLMNIAAIAGLTSSASTTGSSVNLDGVKFLDSSYSYTTLSLGTNTYYRLKNVAYNPTTTLPANRIMYEQLAADVNANYSASHYTASGSDVKSHLVGIDSKLGVKLESVSGDSNPQLGGNLDVNGHNITSSSAININPTTVISVGGIEISPKATITINNNTSAPAVVYSYPASYNSMIMDYGIKRSTDGTRTSTFMVVTDGSSLDYTDYGIDIGDCGVSLTASISSGTVYVNYTSTNTGNAGTMSHTTKKFAI